MERITFASIITTYRCNARCHMCNIWQNPSPKGEEISPAVIDKLPAIPGINITGGEPFLREDLDEILAVLKPKTRRLVISTNGFMTQRILGVAAAHPWIGIRVSLEGLPRANDELRGIRHGFDHGLRTLIELHHLGLKDLGFAMTVSDRNAADLVEVHHLAKMMKVEFATAAVHNSYYFHKFDNRFEHPTAAMAAFEILIKELLASKKPKDWFRAYFNYGLIDYIAGNPRLLPCDMGRRAFFLDPWGEVRPCNVMEETMGNLKVDTFDEIWSSRRAQQVRELTRRCTKNCWMMGSVAGPMKRHWAVPLKWVLHQRLARSIGRNQPARPLSV